jgi:hypothetical protein
MLQDMPGDVESVAVNVPPPESQPAVQDCEDLIRNVPRGAGYGVQWIFSE